MVGSSSLVRIADGYRNNSVGSQNANSASLTSASYNNMMGYNCFTNMTSGTYNIGIGTTIATNLTSGIQNIFIGRALTASSATVSNQTVIGYNLTGITDNSTYIGGTNGTYN